MVIERPLSPPEERILNQAIAELQQAGDTSFSDGNLSEAFGFWLRAARLRQLLGPYEEVAALTRVGSIAWSEQQTTELRFITQRLLAIELETEATDPVDYELMLKIAEGYQALRARRLAVALYNKILANARRNNDLATAEQSLVALGDLHLSWFDYPDAAIAYQELLTLVRQQGDKVAEVAILQDLAHIYTEGDEPIEAIAIRRELIAIHESRQEFEAIPVLKLANGDDYITIGRPDLAAPSYQEAFAVARSVQYYGFAADALKKLANLYLSLDRRNDALVVYQLLIDVEQQSYNYYGLMDAYDQIGQLHQQRGAVNQALLAYRQGLDLAQQLSYRVGYFRSKVEQLSP
ncbi:MAG: tetratricopeptide repeat protein [Leptolyngbyaceae cyanobacterium]